MTSVTPLKQPLPEFGWCGTPDKAAAMQAAGLDYIELQLVPLRIEEDAAFADAKSRVRDLPLPSPVVSYLFPHDLRMVGPAVHEDRARAYIERVVELMSAAKATHVVYGSGWTRNIPEGFDETQAHEQFLRALQWCGAAVGSIGATLVIEPLNRKESNHCNHVVEGSRGHAGRAWRTSRASRTSTMWTRKPSRCRCCPSAAANWRTCTWRTPAA
jgi:sugar phosphate isomerase/epimerase